MVTAGDTAAQVFLSAILRFPLLGRERLAVPLNDAAVENAFHRVHFRAAHVARFDAAVRRQFLTHGQFHERELLFELLLSQVVGVLDRTGDDLFRGQRRGFVR